jgi:hypothetical protein
MATSRRTAFSHRPILGLPGTSAIIGLENKNEAGPAPSFFNYEFISKINYFHAAVAGDDTWSPAATKWPTLKSRMNKTAANWLRRTACVRSRGLPRNGHDALQ